MWVMPACATRREGCVSDEYLDKIPSIGISFQCALHGQRQLVLQSFIERDCSAEKLDGLLDKLRDACERQYAWGQVEDVKLKIKQEHINAAQQNVRIERADEQLKQEWSQSNRKGDLRLTQAQIQKQREAYEVAEAIKKRIEGLTEDLVKWEAKIANGGVGSISDGTGWTGRS